MISRRRRNATGIRGCATISGINEVEPPEQIAHHAMNAGNVAECGDELEVLAAGQHVINCCELTRKAYASTNLVWLLCNIVPIDNKPNLRRLSATWSRC